jgi:hypothetical protein
VRLFSFRHRSKTKQLHGAEPRQQTPNVTTTGADTPRLVISDVDRVTEPAPPEPDILDTAAFLRAEPDAPAPAATAAEPPQEDEGTGADDASEPPAQDPALTDSYIGLRASAVPPARLVGHTILEQRKDSSPRYVSAYDEVHNRFKTARADGKGRESTVSRLALDRYKVIA